MNKLRLEGKVALITGGASGIGEATVRLFIENGASVVIVDVQDDLAKQVIASFDMSAYPGSISYYHCDVRDEKQVEAAVSHTITKYGTLDILFSNAGIMDPIATLLDMDLDVFDNVMAINVRGVAATIKHAARAMIAGGVRGSIIITGSVAASIGGAGNHAYTTSKHAVMGLMRNACKELGAHGIRVNCISPHGMATPLSIKTYNQGATRLETNCHNTGNLKGIILKVTHVAEAVLFLASVESVYVSGLNLAVDGGFTAVSADYTPV